MFVYMNLHAENAKQPCFRLVVIFIKKEGVSQVLNMFHPQLTPKTPHALAPSAKKGSHKY